MITTTWIARYEGMMISVSPFLWLGDAWLSGIFLAGMAIGGGGNEA